MITSKPLRGTPKGYQYCHTHYQNHSCADAIRILRAYIVLIMLHGCVLHIHKHILINTFIHAYSRIDTYTPYMLHGHSVPKLPRRRWRTWRLTPFLRYGQLVTAANISCPLRPRSIHMRPSRVTPVGSLIMVGHEGSNMSPRGLSLARILSRID